jgi:hypothetical protein
MSPQNTDLTVTLRAIDDVSPVLRKIRAEVWLMQHAGAVLIALMLLSAIVGLLVGRFVL